MDESALIEDLRARGAERFDPVGWRFIETLARKVAGYRGDTRRALDGRLAEVLARFGVRLDQARQEASNVLAHGKARFPHAGNTLQEHYDASDFSALRHLLSRLEGENGSTTLAGLLTHIGQPALHPAPGNPATATASGNPPRDELKSLSYFRSTWSKLSVDQALSHSLSQAPENAGPLNSHHLVLQSLSLMRDIAPDYLRHFMSYADALLWLDQADSTRNATRRPRAKR